jgi:spoIIIJ-associated protein
MERSIEVTGDSIEDAIAKGLAQLGVGPAEVIVEVLDEPQAAMFGNEARPAKVRLQLFGAPRSATPISTPIAEPAPTRISDAPPVREQPRERRPAENRSEGEREERRAPRVDDRRRSDQGDRRGPRPERDPRPEREARPERPPRPRRNPEQDLLDSVVDEIDESLPLVNVAEEIPEAQWDEEAQVAKVVLNELLEKMDIVGRIAVRRSAPDDQSGAAPFILDIMSTGNSGRLVGRRGETLAALQYITRLITSRELQRRSDVIVDANSYKARRAQALHEMAMRLADEAVSGDKVVTLEPMPPHERRIVHLALRERPDVTTRSVGEGTARKVTIVPSKSAT